MKKSLFFPTIFLFAETSMYARDISALLQNARSAFDDGNCRSTVENVRKIEQAIGCATKPATACLKIISCLRLNYNTRSIKNR